MQAHANDLRSEIGKEWRSVLDHSGRLEPTSADLDEFVHQAVRAWRECRLVAPGGALLEFAEKVTRRPAGCTVAEIVDLRDVGWSDTVIHDAVQVVAYVNYINRIADALGVEPEGGFPRWGDASPGFDTPKP